MAENTWKVTITVDLDDPALRNTIEEIIRESYCAGYARGECDADRYDSPKAAYEDWRAFGPGVRLPGGQHVWLRVMLERSAAAARAQHYTVRECPPGGSGQATAT